LFSAWKILAKYDFDLVSILGSSNTAVYTCLPLFQHDKNASSSVHRSGIADNQVENEHPELVISQPSPTKEFINAKVVYGWLLVGFKFVEGPLKAPSVDFSVLNSLWNMLVGSSSGSKWGLTSTVLRGTSQIRPSEQYLLENNSSPPSFISLHVALSELQLTSLDAKLSNNGSGVTILSGSDYVVRINSSDCYTNTVEIQGELLPSKVVVWNKDDVLLSVVNTCDLCITLEVSVYRNQSDSLSYIGECKITLPKSEVHHGIPINLSLPLRDDGGIRSGILNLSIHASSLPNEASANPADTGERLVKTVIEEKHLPYLKIEFLEGNINSSSSSSDPVTDSMIPKSVFFESSLQFQNNNDLLKDWIARSGYLSLSSSSTPSASPWDIVVRFTLQHELFSVLRNTNNLESVSLLIECRDASHLSCSVFGRAKISVPTGLFRNFNKGFEQWITLTKPSSSNNNMNLAPVGRVRIRLSLQQLMESGFSPLDEGLSRGSAQGIGVFSCIINGINTSKSPPGIFENTISSATLSNYLVSKGENLNDNDAAFDISNTGNSQNEMNKIDSKLFYPISYSNSSLSMFTSSQSILAANLRLINGYSDISFDIKTDSSLNTFQSTIPIMKMVPKVAENNESLTMSPLILSLMKKITNPNRAKRETGDDDQGGLAKTDPKLSITGCFVPFVEGKLLIQTESIVAVSLDSSPESNPDMNNYVLRYSVGCCSPRFVYTELRNDSDARPSSPSKIPKAYRPTSSKASKTSKRSKSPAPKKEKKFPETQQRKMDRIPENNPVSKAVNIVALNIHTRDLLLEEDLSLQPSPAHSSSTSSLPENREDQSQLQKRDFQVLLPLILHATQRNNNEGAGTCIDDESTENLLVGLCYTAPLYIDALRKVSYEGNGDDTNHNKAADLSWRKVSIELFHKRTRKLMAIANIRLSFQIEHIPHYVSEPIQRLFYGKQTVGVSSEMARLELGLKQAFTLADIDKSHFVSSDELLKVIQNSSNQFQKKSSINKASKVTLGLDDPGKLLYTLAKKASTSSFATSVRTPSAINTISTIGDVDGTTGDFIDPATLTMLVKQLFKRLDVDGDGLISWWEWKSVLTAILCQSSGASTTAPVDYASSALLNKTNRHQKSAFELSRPGTASGSSSSSSFVIDPIDPLLICLFAVSDILSCKDDYHHFSEEINLFQQKNRSEEYRHQQQQPLIKQNNYIESSSVISDTSFAFSTNGMNSKYSKKLHSMIKTLKQSNNILSKRLEDAIIASEQFPSSSSPTTTIPLSDRLHLEQQLDSLNQQSLSYYNQLSNEKQRNSDLSLQLLNEKKNFSIFNTLQSSDLTKLTELQLSLNSELDTIESNRLSKKLYKEKQFNALLTIYSFFHWIVFPYYRKQQLNASKSKLNHLLYSKYHQKKYQEQKKKEKISAITIQRYVHGYLSRKHLKQRQISIIQLQGKYRQRKAKDLVAKKREIRSLFQFVKQRLLGKAVLKVWRGYQIRKKEKAQKLIFYKIVSWIRWKSYQKKKLEKLQYGNLYEKQNQAALIIQAHKRKYDFKTKLREKRQLLIDSKKFHSERTSLYYMNYKPMIDTNYPQLLWCIDKSQFQLHPDRNGLANSVTEVEEQEKKEEKEKKKKSSMEGFSLKSPKPVGPFAKFKVNDKVEGLFEGLHYFPGTITEVSKHGTISIDYLYTILYDDGDVEENVKESNIRILETLPIFKVGDKIESYFDDYEGWYRGIVKELTRKHNQQTYYIVYDDGDEECYVLPSRLRFFQKYNGNFKFHYSINDRIEARFTGGKEWFTGKILNSYKDEDYGPVYDILYDDGDEEKKVKEINIRKPDEGNDDDEVEEEKSPRQLSPRAAATASEEAHKEENEENKLKMELITKEEIPQYDEKNRYLKATKEAYFSELSYFGKVVSINTELRLMEVKFLINLNSDDFHQLFQSLQSKKFIEDPKSFPYFVTRAISFDNPNLVWYSMIKPEGTPPLEGEEEDEEPFMDIPLPLMNEPEPEPEEFDYDGYAPLLPDALRYCYYVSYSKDGKEIYSDLGRVTSIDLQKGLIGVDFNDADENTGLGHGKKRSNSNSPQKSSPSKITAGNDEKDEDVEDSLFWIPYSHPYLYWFNKETELLKSRKELENARKAAQEK
jgi:hypothetical protein